MPMIECTSITIDSIHWTESIGALFSISQYIKPKYIQIIKHDKDAL